MARVKLGKALADETCTTSELMTQAAKRHSSSWLATDDTFGLELGMLELLSGPTCEERITQRVVTMLPSKSRGVTPAASLVLLQAEAGCPGHKLAPLAVQRSMGYVKTLVETLTKDGKVDLDIATSGSTVG